MWLIIILSVLLLPILLGSVSSLNGCSGINMKRLPLGPAQPSYWVIRYILADRLILCWYTPCVRRNCFGHKFKKNFFINFQLKLNPFMRLSFTNSALVLTLVTKESLAHNFKTQIFLGKNTVYIIFPSHMAVFMLINLSINKKLSSRTV